MGNAKIKFLQKPSCTTCRKAKAFLEKRKVELDLRDLGKDRLSVEELDKIKIMIEEARKQRGRSK